MALQIQVDREHIAEFCRKWQVIGLSFFGSVVQGNFRPDSDIDVLVRFAPGTSWGLFDIGRMENDPNAVFGRDVDLVRREAIEQSENYIRRKHILSSVETFCVAG
jgi:predicted nucleotidyltransferase